jgi:hypothetical protein
MEMRTFMEEMRRTPIYRQVIPAEAQIGWPIPLRRRKRAYVTVPFFSIEHVPGNKERKLYPPFASLTFDWANQTPVEYADLRYRNLWPDTDWKHPVGFFPHLAVNEFSIGQYAELRMRLLVMYDHLMKTLSAKKALAPEWKTEFSLLLRILMEPALESYYRTLGPAFFETFLSYLPGSENPVV